MRTCLHIPRPSLLPAILLFVLAAVVGLATLPAMANGETRVFVPVVVCEGCRYLASTTPQPAHPTRGPGTDPRANPDAAEAQLIVLVNAARNAAGCPVARVSSVLMLATAAWSERMAQTGEYKHAPYGWYQSFGYPLGTLENLSGGNEPVERIVEGWLASPLHRRNLLDCIEQDPTSPEYSPLTRYELGVGYVGGYWTLAMSPVGPGIVTPALDADLGSDAPCPGSAACPTTVFSLTDAVN